MPAARSAWMPSRVLDKEKYDLEVVHLGEDKSRISEAKAGGVESVPALMIGDSAFHINFGAGISDLG